MDYKGFVSWGIWGATTGAMRSAFYVSWGLMASLPIPSGTVLIAVISSYFRRLMAVEA